MATAEHADKRRRIVRKEPPQSVRRFAANLAQDPLAFVKHCWPEMLIYDKQRHILESVRDNSETFVHAANEMGKTWVAALVAIYFYATRTPARVIVTSAAERQLKNVLWSNIEHLIYNTPDDVRLPFDVRAMIVNKWTDGHKSAYETNDYMIGQVTKRVENFQGHHLPQDKPRVLLVMDEASGIDDEFYEAADSWAHRKLIISNPLNTVNFFYRHCRDGDLPRKNGSGHVRKVIHIDGLDSPNIQIADEYARRGIKEKPPLLIPGLLTREEFDDREAKNNEIYYTIRLRGKFYEGDQAMLFPMEWLRLAEERYADLKAKNELGDPLAMGVDVAWGGRDDSCWCAINDNAVTYLKTADTPDTMHMCGETKRLIDRMQIPSRRVCIDAGGGGKVIAQRLQEQGVRVNPVGFGEVAIDNQQFKNKRAEMFGVLRMWLDPDGRHKLALPPDHELRRELSILPLLYDSEGKMRMLSKQKRDPNSTEITIQDILGRSPDRADALALAVYAMHTTRRIPKASTNMDRLQPDQQLKDKLERLAELGTAKALERLAGRR